jgi:hypothetical protein
MSDSIASAPQRADNAGRDSDGPRRLHPVLIFVIGCFAAICAVFLPKFVVYLNQRAGDLVVMTPAYVAIGMAFAALLGFGAVIFEWNKQSKPSEVFMTALGLPALISGAFNTSGTAENLSYEVAQRERAFVQAATAANVPVLDPRDLQARQKPERRGAGFELIPSAVAAEPGPILLAQATLGVMAKAKRYQVVLFQTQDAALAQARLQTARAQFPSAAIQTLGPNTFLVTTSSQGLPEQDALNEAQRLRQAGREVALVAVRD